MNESEEQDSIYKRIEEITNTLFKHEKIIWDEFFIFK